MSGGGYGQGQYGQGGGYTPNSPDYGFGGGYGRPQPGYGGNPGYGSVYPGYFGNANAGGPYGALMGMSQGGYGQQPMSQGFGQSPYGMNGMGAQMRQQYAPPWMGGGYNPNAAGMTPYGTQSGGWASSGNTGIVPPQVAASQPPAFNPSMQMGGPQGNVAPMGTQQRLGLQQQPMLDNLYGA
jgi:hypothetical protein